MEIEGGKCSDLGSKAARHPFIAHVAAAMVALVGCGAEGRSLTVDVRSDLLPGVEVDRLEVLMPTRGVRALELREHTPLAAGVRTGRYEGLPAGPYRVTVRLFEKDRIALERTVDVAVRGRESITVVLSRSCRDVACGSDRQCVGGMCVPPGCVSLSECGEPQCHVAEDCPATTVTCGRPICAGDGACLVLGDDSMCGARGMCHPNAGCVEPERPPLADGGVGADHGATATPDLGVADVGPTDAYIPTDAGGPSDVYREMILSEMSLLGYWRLDESSVTDLARDESPHGRDGYYQGDVVTGAPGISASHGGVRLNELRPARVVIGDTDLDGVDDLDVFDFDGSRAFSVEAWVQLGARTTTGCIVGKTSFERDDIEWLLAVHDQDSRDTVLRFGLAGTTVGTASLNPRWPGDPSARYHHVVAVYTGPAGRTLQLYIDGVLQVQRTHPGAASGRRSDTPLTIGEVPNWSRPRNTLVDEVAIYGDALSATRIAEHFRAGTGTLP